MLFNSLHFIYFFAVTIVLGNILKGRSQRIFLLFASFYFYMAWNVYFITLLLASTVLDYLIAVQLQKTEDVRKRKILLTISMVGNLGLLCYFKYTNFLLGAVNDVNFWGTSKFPIYDITLPVGISFYTFQSMSYTIDVYRKQIDARQSFVDFALYVSFFPQLVAGPIVRATTFFRDLDDRLPVLNKDIQVAISMILIGFVRKIVFADNLGVVVDDTFRNYQTMNALEIWTGAIAFGWQIYFDFAGYTDIAIGVARLFGFQFDPNFNFPMWTSSISDHWMKWHISFTTWIRDYIFIPLGGSRGSIARTYINIFITWLFGGIWHGAAYHYVAWGVWQAVMISIHREYMKTKLWQVLNEKGGMIYGGFCRIFTMFCLGFGFVMFRAETLTKAVDMIRSMLLIHTSSRSLATWRNYDFAILLLICFIAAGIFSRRKISSLESRGNALVYMNIACILMLIIFGVAESQNFLYFAF